ncbi:MAG TPA: aldehyde dehydrogenase family protein [Geminicoccaceae bacterium]|nr:aldehyde dehydrogenase family protein [Geminicoccaceae bacterium]
MGDRIRVISPVDGQVYAERALASEGEIATALERARGAQEEWRGVPVAERAAILSRAVDAFVAKRDEIALELTWQMGRPVRSAPGEVGGFEERARYMIEVAKQALADVRLGDKPGFTRFIRRVPLGVVFVIAPWNYPYLTAVNAVVPALMAGNAVILKHSAQTPLCAERMGEAFAAGGLPAGVFQHLHISHDAAARIIASGEVEFVSFTGSVAGGHGVQEAAAPHFLGVGLELGGKDPAYVRPDADLDHATLNLADGAFFNSGQSCCAIERIYVHRDVYDRFVDGLIEVARSYRLGDPTDPETTLGPLVRPAAADFVRAQVQEAVAAGARAHIDPKAFAGDAPGTAYLAPQVLTGVDHSTRIMTEETFGPAVGVMAVASDDEAVRLMNDSRYGLTAAIWTSDEDAAIRIGDRVETGTWFMNRCDYLDPALAWTGVKDSGRGCSLSRLQYEHLTRPKSFHLRTAV